MEGQTLFDVVLGLLMVGIGMMMRRFWQLVDQLRSEDGKLHQRITDLSVNAESRDELLQAIDRILARIDRLEEKLLNRE